MIETTVENKGTKKKKKIVPLELKVWKLHNRLLKLGKIGLPIIKLTAFYCLYKLGTNGGLESLAYVSYEYMLTRGKALQEQYVTQSRMRKNKG